MIQSISDLTSSFDKLGYVVDEELATVLFLMTSLQKPLLLEGPPGVGKTEVANILSAHLNTELIRLQCYEGLDVHSAVYEWNYQKQLLSIKIQESNQKTDQEKEKHIFGKEFLMPRPLLKAILNQEQSPVLLIDEIDRSDEEFEAFLLELLSAFQISIPEFGTIKAGHRPLVVLTSNRTRELSDALRRRCLYHWVAYPSIEKELHIIRKRLPDIDQKLSQQIVKTVNALRKMELEKSPGISETLDWALSLHALGRKTLNETSFAQSIGAVLKSHGDIERIKSGGLAALIVES